MVKRHLRFRSEVEKGLRKITISLPEKDLSWFYELSKAMKESGGYRLPRTYITRSLIRAFTKLDINVDGVKSEEELDRRLPEAIKRW